VRELNVLDPWSAKLIEDCPSQHLIKSQTVDLVKPPDGGGVVYLMGY
jgi:hypothetical protein